VPRQGRQLLVGNLVQPRNGASILLAQLRQPHIGAFGDQYRRRHPGRVRRKLLVLIDRVAKARHLGVAEVHRPVLLPALAPSPRGFFRGCPGLRRRRIELHPDGQFFLVQNLAGNLQIVRQTVAQQWLPKLANQS